MPAPNTPPAPLPDSTSLPSQPWYPSHSRHPMQTRSKSAIIKPNPKYSLHSVIPPNTKPSSINQTLKDLKWAQAMKKEYNALTHYKLIGNLLPNSQQNLVGNEWVFRITRNLNGSMKRFEARLVAKGFHQQLAVDFHETFSLVVNPVTVRTVLSLAVIHLWAILQFDVNNEFLNNHFQEEVFRDRPSGMRETND